MRPAPFARSELDLVLDDTLSLPSECPSVRSRASHRAVCAPETSRAQDGDICGPARTWRGRLTAQNVHTRSTARHLGAQDAPPRRSRGSLPEATPGQACADPELALLERPRARGVTGRTGHRTCSFRGCPQSAGGRSPQGASRLPALGLRPRPASARLPRSARLKSASREDLSSASTPATPISLP